MLLSVDISKKAISQHEPTYMQDVPGKQHGEQLPAVHQGPRADEEEQRHGGGGRLGLVLVPGRL